MQVKQFEDVKEYYQRVEPFLMAHEAEHCLMLGICNNLMTSDFYREPPYLGLVEDKEGVIGAALRTPPHNLVLSEALNETTLALILDDVAEVYDSLPGVLGPKTASKAFAGMWTSKKGKSHCLNMAERIYKLNTVRPVSSVSGEGRPARDDDRDLLIEWFMAFSAEALDGMSNEDAERGVDLRLSRDADVGGLRIWWNGSNPVSFAGYGGPTPNGIRIGPVYTPPDLRGHGYASACVAALSQEMFNRGREFCVLFTDLSNPTSNHVYQNIGYEPVSDFDEYRFAESSL